MRTRHPLFADLLLFAVSAAVVLFTIGVQTEPGARPVAPYGYLFGLAIAAPVLLRRTRPGAAVVFSGALLMAYYSLNFPGFSPFLALAVQLYSAAVTGHVRIGALVAAWVSLGGLLARLTRAGDIAEMLPGQLTEIALIVGSLLLGELVRARRVLRREMAEGVRRAVREAEQESERKAMADRLAIARDLHDVLAHTVAVIGVQANVAAELLDTDPPRARTAVETIRTAAGEALGDLGKTIRLLRFGAAGEPVHGLADVPELVERTCRTGVAVRLTVTGEPVTLRAAVDSTAYRVIQESLTNVIRHAEARTAEVAIGYSGSALDIRVTDDGVGSAAGSGPRAGHGLIGMRERIMALRGDFAAGDGAGGGYAVTARIPVRR